MAGKNGTVFFTTIGRHLECAIQTELVIELNLALIERKQSRRFRHCAMAKGHAELKIEKPRVKTLSYDFPRLHHSNTNSFHANIHLCQMLKINGLGREV